MEKDVLKEPIFNENTIEEMTVENEIIAHIRSGMEDNALLEILDDYHENDVAGAIEQLETEERLKLYPILGLERLAEIYAYVEDPIIYLREVGIDKAAEIISYMDSDDAVDILEELDDETQATVVSKMDAESSRDVQLILSYDEDEIGNAMTTNFVSILRTCSIRQAMSELVKQAGENDNIQTIYVVDDEDKFYGAIDLKDLIRARANDELEDIIVTEYPCLDHHELISECIERVKDYAEDSIPVLNEWEQIVGVITSQDIVEAVDDEMGEDYAMLAGLTAEEDLNETTRKSVRKRLPWLIVLLFLGLLVSSVVGVFEGVIAALPIVMCFQSLILGMSGNVGTQSLAVTIRVLMDENLTGSQKAGLVFKELKVGFSNGALLGLLACAFIGAYLYFFKDLSVGDAFLVSACVGASLLGAMCISSMVGTLIPMFFHKIKVDPAVASGPLISTTSDFVAVVTYYGLTWIFLINIFGMVG